MPAARYYSPRLQRDLISLLYHAAKARRIPMTRFASSLVREGLVRLAGASEDEVCVVCEVPPVNDPHGRKD